MIGKRRCGTYAQWHTMQPQEKWNPATCDNVDGSWEYHVQWNKSDRKSQEPYDFTMILFVGYKTESNKWVKKKNKQTETYRHRQQSGGYQREGVGE